MIGSDVSDPPPKASLTFAERLRRFYIDYADVVLTREWSRIYFFAALRGVDIDKRNFLLVRHRILHPIARQMRGEVGCRRIADPISPMEEEIVWELHAAIFYLRIREWILDLPAPMPIEEAIALRIAIFLGGARSTFAAATAEQPANPARRRGAIR